MAWSAISATDVEEALSGPELAAVRTRAGASDGSDDDKLAGIIAKVTDQVRGYIEACPKNRVGAAGTLPERVHLHAIALIRVALLNRLNLNVSEARMEEYKEARRYFERVSECKVSIEQPDGGDVVTEANSSEIETINKPTSQASRAKLNGLY